jgi:hypothetical protein
MRNNLTERSTMPSGTYPLPSLIKRRDEPPLSIRLRTWWRRRRHDRSLAAGSRDPAASQELQQRARQLTSKAGRDRLAGYVEELVSEAHDRPSSFTTRTPFSLTRLTPFSFTTLTPQRRADVHRCTAELLSLAQRLREDRLIEVQGAAKLSRLLNDRTGPLYTSPRAAPFTLEHAVRSTRQALDRQDAVETTLSAAA